MADEKMKKSELNDTIRAKMVKHEREWVSYLNGDEAKIIKSIMDAVEKKDKDKQQILKTQFPDLYFIIELKMIAGEMPRFE